MKRVAVIGECLIELNGTPFGTLRQTYGGDSLNTALYLARLTRDTAAIHFVTALGTDILSDGMLDRWAGEGIATDMVLRDAARLPGMYMIEIDATGERTFLYWRGQSAARHLLQHPQFDRVAHQLCDVDLIFVTAISLAILPPDDRAELIKLLIRLAKRGIPIALDTNYRRKLWSSIEESRDVIHALLPAVQLVFATFEDEQQLWGDATPQDTIARLHAAEVPSVVVKLGAEGCLFSDGTNLIAPPPIRVSDVVDTTAAGDSFNAGFLGAWLCDSPFEACCSAGNRLASIVIRHKGAIMPTSAMPSLTDLLQR